MLMPDMSWQTSGYRYGFGGHENDNDVKGTGNHSSFGDYGYDPRVARRFMLEPMIAKYPSLSPYVAFADNPILFKDPSGEDYSVYVDHSEKVRKITVKAVLYVQKGKADDFNSAKSASEFWNQQSGKYQYKVGRFGNAILYDINFEVKVIPVDNPYGEKTSDMGQDYFEGQPKKSTKDNSSNIYELLPNDDSSFILDNGEVHNGNTSHGFIIKVKEERKDSETGGHEFGHALGFGHLDFTIMSEYSNLYRSNKINETIIQQILQNAGIGNKSLPKEYKNNEATGTYYNSGTSKEPDGFKNGKVIEK